MAQRADQNPHVRSTVVHSGGEARIDLGGDTGFHTKKRVLSTHTYSTWCACVSVSWMFWFLFVFLFFFLFFDSDTVRVLLLPVRVYHASVRCMPCMWPSVFCLLLFFVFHTFLSLFLFSFLTRGQLMYYWPSMPHCLEFFFILQTFKTNYWSLQPYYIVIVTCVAWSTMLVLFYFLFNKGSTNVLLTVNATLSRVFFHTTNIQNELLVIATILHSHCDLRCLVNHVSTVHYLFCLAS